MGDEKDRLADRLKEKEKAEEERYFQERERLAIERLRRERARAAQQQLQMRCPKDGALLVSIKHLGVTVEECPTCGGTWFDKGELETVARRECESWLGRFFLRPRL